VNFQNHNEAKRALETMNFESINQKPIRIMWSQRDPTIRRSGAGNIFIKNLNKTIDTKSLFDTFSLFGSILSCKIAGDETGKSKGFGFIHFEKDESAADAITKVNGMLLDGKKVYVSKFLPKSARQQNGMEGSFTNVFVKNFGDKIDDSKLKDLFSKFGEITSHVVARDENNKSKGFGFVAFQNPESAALAVKELDGFELPGSDQKLVVCRAQTKTERQAELKKKYEQRKTERMLRYKGMNLYVKNLDLTVDDEALRMHFEPFGKISNAKVMYNDKGESRGFGFVCYEEPDDAQKAIGSMNNKIIGQKPLYVAYAQRKDERKAQLAQMMMQRMARQQQTAVAGGVLYVPTNQGFSAMAAQRLPQYMGMNAAPMPYNQQRTRGSRFTNTQTRTANYSNPTGYNVHAGNYNMQSTGYPSGYNVHPSAHTAQVQQMSRAPTY